MIPSTQPATQKTNFNSCHCVKSVLIQSFSGPYFPTFGLNMERYSVSLYIQSEYRKIRTRKNPNTDTFYAVCLGFQECFKIMNKSHLVTVWQLHVLQLEVFRSLVTSEIKLQINILMLVSK